MLMNLYKLDSASYSYVDEENSVFTKEDIMLWADDVAYSMFLESDEHPEPPKNIDQALDILESANEFLVKI